MAKNKVAALVCAAFATFALSSCTQGVEVDRAVGLPTEFPIPAIAFVEAVEQSVDEKIGEDANGSASISDVGLSDASVGSTSSVTAPSGSSGGTQAPPGGSNVETHAHNWTYHEATYENKPVYAARVVCSCGQVFSTQGEWSAHNKALVLQDPASGHSYSVRDVQVGSDSVLVSAAYYSCSCGATK